MKKLAVGALGVVLHACLVNSAFAVDFGRTAGSFNVSGGNANYTIPVWTPPGPNGVTPGIALTYSSGSGNGLGGVGWHLTAVSSIERCTRTKGQDGYGAPVDLSTNDRFCIGGNRLRLGSGTYGAASSVYYTEIADYSRITAYGTAGNGPQYFIVEAKSGMKYEYGATTSSRVLLGATALRWMLDKVYDRNGNNYVISYNNTNGFAVPDVISWTPTYLGSASYRYNAKFNYLTTRTDEDSYLGMVAGYSVANRYRLDNIQIKSAGVVVRKYQFAYDTSTATYRSRLASAKECSDDAETNCLLPLTFGYQLGQTGVTATPVAALSGITNLIRGKYDFNGDGKSDLLYVTGSTWKVSFSTGTGYGAVVDTGVSSTATFSVGRFLASQKDGLLVDVSSVWYYVGYNGSSFISTSTGTPVQSGSNGGQESRITDNNGDGLTDLLWAAGGSIKIRLNTTTAGSAVPSFGSEITAATFTVGQGNVAIIPAQVCPIERFCDYNGDGRADVSVNVVAVTNCGIGGCTVTNAYYDLLASGSGYITGAPTGPVAFTGINFNDDRCIDRIVSSANQMQVSGCNSGAPTGVTTPSTPKLVLDWNGDGNGDILVNNGGYFGVYLSRANTAAPFSSLISTSVPFSLSCNYFALDVDGDGFDDIACQSTSSPYAVTFYPHNGSGGTFVTQKPDLMNSVVDGFGATITPAYVSTAQSNYTAGTGTQAPLVDVTDPITVVGQVTSSNGIGGTFTNTYSYVGARSNEDRGEYAGFQRIDEVDSRNSLISRTYFEQLFPTAGMVSQQELMQANGVTTISRNVSTNVSTLLDSTANNQRYFIFTSGSTATKYEFGSAWNGNLVSTVTTTNTFDSTTGALYDQTVVTSEPASGANGLNAGGSWTAHTYAPLANMVTNTTNWCLGRPGQVQQINSHNLPSYGTAITRTKNVTWNTVYCRPTQTVDEPGSSTLQVTTDIGYDGFGNVNSTTVTGMNAGVAMTPRTSSTGYTDSTHTTGQFPMSITNALSQTSTTAWDYDRAVPTSATDANGITVGWTYDGFGRRNRENRPDATYTTWDISQYTGSNPAIKTQVDMQSRNAAGGVYGHSYAFLDLFDRSIVDWKLRADNAYSFTGRGYDALGRLTSENLPYTDAAPTIYTVTTQYDDLGRPMSTSRPVSDTNSSLQTTTFYYEGLTTRVVDPQSKQTTRTIDPRGDLIRSKDNDNYYQQFDYDAFGGVMRVQDSAGNTLQSSTYNLRGMLTQRIDMDMGTWSFTPDSLGEVTSLTDAKSQTSTFQFDLLGRVTTRTEAEGTSTWTWGTSSASKNIGKLASISGPGGYSESYTYDSLGRPSNTSITADTTYQFDYTYNTIGRLDTLTYPTSPVSPRLKLLYQYNNGYLTQVKDYNTPSVAYWTANTLNPRDQVTQATLGNGIVTNTAFDSVTGLLKTIQSGVGGGTGVQNLAYTWDLVGNLLSRKDVNQSNLTETFVYDNLYRLDYSQLNAVTNLDVSYAALGNITSKSDVGTYTYDSTKKHQLVSTSNGWSFTYDNNGNMLTGRGATITWTSYNYPASVTNGGVSSQFSYTPNRQYWKQVAQYTDGTATTIYVGGLLEKVTTASGTDYKHMIMAGGARIIVSRRTDGQNVTWYSLSDSLGSSSTVTTSAGAVQVALSYAAFGARRGSNWQGSPTSGEWTNIAGISRRGFSDHSMLDNVNLIHMNGRIYDPLLGRMMSADPTIPGGSTQSFNRYSYVNNNPLSLTDPSGFAPGQNLGRVYRRDGNDDDISPAQEFAMLNSAVRFPVGADQPHISDFSGLGWFQFTHMQGFRTSDGAQRIAGMAGARLDAYAQVTIDIRPESVATKDGTSTTTVYYIYAGEGVSNETMIGKFNPALGVFRSSNNPAYRPDSSGLQSYLTQRYGSFGANVRQSAIATLREAQHQLYWMAAAEVGGLAIGYGIEAVLAARTTVPLGFESAVQFQQACSELCSALRESGVTDFSIGVRGSSITGRSFETGASFSASSDIDFFVSSSQMRAFPINSYGLVYPSTLESAFPAIGEWSSAWSNALGRPVSVGGFGGLPEGAALLVH